MPIEKSTTSTSFRLLGDRSDEIAGQEFGYWTAIRIVGRNRQKYAIWEIRCRCGFSRQMSSKDLRSGKSTKCRSCAASARRRKPGEDWTGRRFGSVIVLGPSAGNERFRINGYWDCLCDCGETIRRTGDKLKSGRYSCLKCRYKRAEKRPFLTIWSSIRCGAKSRGLELAVSMEEAFELLDKQGCRCALTGVPIQIADTGKEHLRGGTTASLDRIDSGLGYVHGNIQWILKDLNQMKMDLPQERFIELCRLVAKHHAEP